MADRASFRPGVLVQERVVIRMPNMRTEDTKDLTATHIGRYAVDGRLPMRDICLRTTEVVIPHKQPISQLVMHGNTMLLTG